MDRHGFLLARSGVTSSKECSLGGLPVLEINLNLVLPAYKSRHGLPTRKMQTWLGSVGAAGNGWSEFWWSCRSG